MNPKEGISLSLPMTAYSSSLNRNQIAALHLITCGRDNMHSDSIHLRLAEVLHWNLTVNSVVIANIHSFLNEYSVIPAIKPFNYSCLGT